MKLTTRIATAAATTLLAATGAAVAASPAQAAPLGYSAVESCTGLTGSISYTPGLVKRTKAENAVFVGTLSGCSGINGAQTGTGSVTAVLSGQSSFSSVSLTGNVTVSWPASSGLNPSNGTVRFSQLNQGQFTVSGQVTSGAFTGSLLSTALLPFANTGAGTRANPLTAQQVVNTLPFASKINLG
ncbi:MAG TPA: hypothetical protein VFJ97_12525 [Dermatophilaceae bacterium]|nr:hypothetical protein [Dermatophilaceae bacterium]